MSNKEPTCIGGQTSLWPKGDSVGRFHRLFRPWCSIYLEEINESTFQTVSVTDVIIKSSLTSRRGLCPQLSCRMVRPRTSLLLSYNSEVDIWKEPRTESLFSTWTTSKVSPSYTLWLLVMDLVKFTHVQRSTYVINVVERFHYLSGILTEVLFNVVQGVIHRLSAVLISDGCHIKKL